MVRARTKPDWFRLGIHRPRAYIAGRQIHKSRRSQPNFLAYLAYLKSRDPRPRPSECFPASPFRVANPKL
jgi:hypothetical protein